MMRSFVEKKEEGDGQNTLCFRWVCGCLALVNILACGGVFATGTVLDSEEGFAFTEGDQPLVKKKNNSPEGFAFTLENKPLVTEGDEGETEEISTFAKWILCMARLVLRFAVSFSSGLPPCCAPELQLPLWLPTAWAAHFPSSGPSLSPTVSS